MRPLTSCFDMNTHRFFTAALVGLSFFTNSVKGQQVDTAQGKPFIRTLLLQEVVVKPSRTIAEAERNLRQHSLQELSDEILESTPGINMIRRGNFAMEPTLRSLSNSQITVSIDGMRIFGACTDRMDPVSSYIEPNNLESFSLSHEPGSNTWGSGIGGGINFKLKKPSLSDEVRLSGLFGTGIETNGGALQTLAGMEYSTANFALQANGIFRKSGSYKAAGGQSVTFSQYRKWNGNLSAIVKTEGTSYLRADYLQDEGFDIGYPALTMDVAFAKAKIGALSYVKNNINHRERWETKVYINYVDHAMDDTKRPAETVPMHMDMPGTSRTYGIFSAVDLHLSDKHHLKAQIDGFRNELSATMTMYPGNGTPMFMYTLADPARNSVGLNLSDVITLTDQFMLTPSLRLEYVSDGIRGQEAKEQLSGMFNAGLSRKHFVANMNITANYQPDMQWLLSLSAAHGARPASLQEAYAFYIYNRPDAFDYIGNPYLDQERSLNLSAGASYRKQAIELNVNLFGYFIGDYITGKVVPGYSTMTIGARGVKQYVNLASARLYGAELGFRWQLAHHLIFSSSTTYTRGTDNEGFALPLIAPLKTVNTVSYSFGKSLLRMESTTNAAQRHISYGRYGETGTPASSVLNAYAGTELLLKQQTRLRLSTGLENIFDEHYYQHLDVMKIARPGRNLTFRATILF